ncbi:MAG TPA: biotin transporter BioY [Lachnospiraceae bacterium]|nr:biotin transporter BioY [Lachnospiraceae bacterium]
MGKDRAAGRGIKTTDIVYCGMFASLMAVGAFIKIMIPLGVFEVTFSLQFFFALLAGFLLGSSRGLAAVGCYLMIGLAGVPVFAHGGGLMYLMKPTFGFLIGFAAAAFVAGKIAETMPGNGFFKLVFAAFWGEMAYYLCGLVYYYLMFNFVVSRDIGIGLYELISVWFLSTVIPDFVLCVLAAGAAVRLRPVIFKERAFSVRP